MTLRIIGFATGIAASLFIISCDQPGYEGGDTTIYRIPVVVHVIHRGEPEGTGSLERICTWRAPHRTTKARRGRQV